MSKPTQTTWVSPQAAALLPRVDTVIFDIDGVLLDVSHSIRAVNIAALPAALRLLPGWKCSDTLLSSPDIERFKTAGGFNDDLDLACALVLLYLFKSARYHSRDADALHRLWPTIADYTDALARRGGWLLSADAFIAKNAGPSEVAEISANYNAPLIKQIFLELRFGNACQSVYDFVPQFFPGAGNVDKDVSLLDAALLPASKTLAVMTGRTLREAQIGLQSAGIAGIIPLPERGITSDEGFHKPRPHGLLHLLTQKLPETGVAVYIGDAVDDMKTVLNFRALPHTPQNVTVLSAQVLTGTAGVQSAEDAARLFAPADICAQNVNAVLKLLAPPKE